MDVFSGDGENFPDISAPEDTAGLRNWLQSLLFLRQPGGWELMGKNPAYQTEKMRGTFKRKGFTLLQKHLI